MLGRSRDIEFNINKGTLFLFCVLTFSPPRSLSLSFSLFLSLSLSLFFSNLIFFQISNFLDCVCSLGWTGGFYSGKVWLWWRTFQRETVEAAGVAGWRATAQDSCKAGCVGRCHLLVSHRARRRAQLQRARSFASRRPRAKRRPCPRARGGAASLPEVDSSRVGGGGDAGEGEAAPSEVSGLNESRIDSQPWMEQSPR